MYNHYLDQLLINAPSLHTMLVSLAILLVVSTIIGLLVVGISASYLGHKKSIVLIALLCLQIFMPVIGNILAISSIFLFKRCRKTIYPSEIKAFQNPMYIRKNPVPIPAYAEGWAALRLNLSHFSENERKQALISLSRGDKQHTNLIYQRLVSDDMEELRICAFSLLENQQNAIHDKINELIKIFTKKSDSPTEAAWYAKQIALLFWELIYLNLGDKEFRKVILERSQFYANIAVTYYPEDPVLLILLSKIAIANQHTAEGIALLKTAQQRHAPNSKIGPYLAENAFLARDYNQVQHYLSYDRSFQYILKIREIVKFWCTYDSISL